MQRPLKTGIIVSVIAFVLALCAAPARAAESSGLQEGDIIFIQSGSSQAPAIAEVMGSSWTHVGIVVRRDSEWLVAEAAGPVKLTPLGKFIKGSAGGRLVVKRLKKWSRRPPPKELAALNEWLFSKLGKDYDIYFEWSDSALYCSEYVWKAYYEALSWHPVLSRPQKFSDLKLDGPLAKRLIDKRYGAAGKKLDPEEPIVTPVALLNSGLLLTVPR